jgi:hypothetical protein
MLSLVCKHLNGILNQTSVGTLKEDLGKEVDHGPYKTLAFSIQMSIVYKSLTLYRLLFRLKGSLHWGPTLLERWSWSTSE